VVIKSHNYSFDEKERIDIPHWFASGEIVHYESPSDSAGRWVTIGGRQDDHGKRHGGTPVYIDGDGRVLKGHKSLVGKPIDALSEDPKKPHRARWAKEARQAGIGAKDLHQLAAEFVAHSAADVAEHNNFLKGIRKAIEAHGTGHGKVAHLLAAQGKDSSSIKRLDQVKESLDGPHRKWLQSMVAQHPGSHETDLLWDLLTVGNKKAMSEEDAYRQAFDHLHASREMVPFARPAMPIRYGAPIAPAQHYGYDPTDRRPSFKKEKKMNMNRDGLAAFAVIVANSDKFCPATVQYAREQLAAPQSSVGDKPDSNAPGADTDEITHEQFERYLAKHHPMLQTMIAKYGALNDTRDDLEFGKECRLLQEEMKRAADAKKAKEPADNDQGRIESEAQIYGLINDGYVIRDPGKERDRMMAMTPVERLEREIEIREHYEKISDVYNDDTPDPAVVSEMVRYGQQRGWANLEDPAHWHEAKVAVTKQRRQDHAVRDAVGSQIDGRMTEDAVKYAEANHLDIADDADYDRAMQAVMQQRRR